MPICPVALLLQAVCSYGKKSEYHKKLQDVCFSSKVMTLFRPFGTSLKSSFNKMTNVATFVVLILGHAWLEE